MGWEVEVLLKKNLGNGVSFTITEQSRVIAADRWYVKVVGLVSLPLSDVAFAALDEADPALLARVRRHLGEVLEHQLVKDRNFVDAAAKEEVVGELVGQLMDSSGAYLASEAFPASFLAKKYREAREICRIAMVREAIVSTAPEEPVDFSHCFR